MTLGATYLKLREFAKAIDYQNKALEIAKSKGYLKIQYECYASLSNMYSKFGDPSRATEYYNKALKIKERGLVGE